MQSKFLFPGVHDNIVSEFCNKCKILKYVNNSSFKAMKWYWEEVQWAGTFIDDTLVSLSGIHKFPEIDENAFRVMFRGVTLPGISSKFLNLQQIPLLKEWAYIQNEKAKFYVTFNIDSNIGCKSSRMIKIAKRRNFKFINNINYFNVKQEVYLFTG